MLISWDSISLNSCYFYENIYLKALVEKYNSFIELFLFDC
jgi:hypothetical protein